MTSAQVRISQDFAATAKPGEYRDDKLKGFVLKVFPSGVKSYQVHARIRGAKQMTRYTIGQHSSPWTAAKARTEAEYILIQMKQGIDPRRVLKQQLAQEIALREAEAKEQKGKEFTLRLMFERWQADDRKVKESTQKLYCWVLHKHLKDWLDKPMIEITPDMVVKRYDKIALSSIASANNSLAALSKCFRWAIREYPDVFVNGNPAPEVARREKKQTNKPRENHIQDDDLKDWFKAVASISSENYRDFFLFILLNALRKSEAAELKWEDVSFRNGSFVARDTKNHRDHWLPMTAVNKALLERCKSRRVNEFVFPGKSSKGHIHDTRYWTDQVSKQCKVDFTSHPLRRTFSYAAARCRISEAERQAILNHVNKSNVTQQHYTPWHVEHLLEPLTQVQNILLERCGVTAGDIE